MSGHSVTLLQALNTGQLLIKVTENNAFSSLKHSEVVFILLINVKMSRSLLFMSSQLSSVLTSESGFPVSRHL